MSDKINFSEPGMIFLSKGTTRDNKPYWAYLMVPEENLLKYAEIRSSGKAFDLSDYGIILEWDIGTDPPKDVKEEMAKHYNAQEDFLEKFMTNLRSTKQGKEFIKQLEEIIEKHNNSSGS